MKTKESYISLYLSTHLQLAGAKGELSIYLYLSRIHVELPTPLF